MTTLQALAFWALSIWDPAKMDFLRGRRRARLRLYYRAKGIVMHDRILNGEFERKQGVNND